GIADSSTFFMILAAFLGLKARTLSARSTGRPRIWSATSRPFWAEMRTPRRIALVSIVSSLLPRRRRRDNLLVGGMRLERPRQSKFAKLVPDHVLRDIHGNMLLAVVDRDRQPDEIWRDRRTTRPRLDGSLVRGRPRRFHFR